MKFHRLVREYHGNAQAAETIGASALLAHAKNDEAGSFYDHFTFEASPSDPHHLLLLMKDLLREIQFSLLIRSAPSFVELALLLSPIFRQTLAEID
jgi:hypothetical protein